MEFEFPFGDTGEAARWILGRGPGFAPVGPPALVQAWKTMILTLAEKTSPSALHALVPRN